MISYRRVMAFLAALAAGLVLSSAEPARAELIDKQFDESFEVTEADRLFLSFGDGDVEILPWDRDVVDVHVVYRAEHRGVGVGRKGEFSVEFRRDGSVIRVIGHEGWTAGFFIGRTTKRYQYVYTVQAPPYLDLELVGDDGDVSVSGWAGSIELSSEDGDAHLERVATVDARTDDGDLVINGQAGPLQLRTEDGDITVADCGGGEIEARVDDGEVEFNRCSGRFRVTTEDGDIVLREVDASAVAIRTDDGNAELDLVSVGALDIDIVTEDGNVDLALDREISARFSIETDDGRIRLDADGATDVSKQNDSMRGTFGQGEGSIRITTQDGQVTLRQKGR